MLADVVIDTNVFVHADNPEEQRHGSCVQLLDLLLDDDTATRLGVDEGFDLDPAKNKSLIGHEYLEKLTPLSAAFRVISHLAQSGRTTFIPKTFDQATRKKVNQLVKNKRDRTFLLVASKTKERVLCSHDFKDFGKSKRKTIKSKLDVEVVEASDVVSALSAA